MGWMGLSAQGISVTSFKPLPNDLTANLAGTQVKDQNGEVAALIKVVTTQTGFTFEGGMAGIVKTKQEVGEIWVYVPHGIQKITIKHPQLGVLRDYFFPCAIDAARTYEMVLASGEVRTVVTQDAGGSFLALTVEPKNASVYINGELQQIDDNGELMVMLPYGEHQYRIEANGYMNEAGVIAVGKETMTKAIRLKSALATLKINSTTPGADIIVNNQKRGTGSWSGSLTAGMYLIECQKPGYHSYQTSITLAKQEEKALTIPALTAKYGSIVVSVKPIGAEVWMDGALLGTSPGVFSNVLATKHTIEVKKAGYQTLRKTFELAEGEKNTIDGALEKEQAAAPAPAPSGSGSGGSSRGSGSGSSSGSSSPRSSGSLQLFPVWGITLGNTTVSDMKRLGFTVEPQSGGANYSRVHSIQFWDHSKDGVYETIYFPVSTTAPDLWTSQGLNGSLSYNEYIRFFTSRGFTYKVTKEPQVKKWQNRNTLSADLVFTSSDGNYSFEIDFDYGNDNGEGYTVDSKNTAYSFRVKALKSVAAASGSSTPRSYGSSSGGGSLKLFPVWGVDLGKSTASDLKAQGYTVENRSDGDKYASIRGIQCWDFSHDGRFETMYFTYYDGIPSEWEAQGFNTKMSYNEYIRFFTSHGYTYTVKEAPQVKKYEKRNTLSAELEFTSADGRYVIRIDFDYGNDNGEGYTVDSKCSAYSFNIKAK